LYVHSIHVPMNDMDLRRKSLAPSFQIASHVRRILFHYQMSLSFGMLVLQAQIV